MKSSLLMGSLLFILCWPLTSFAHAREFPSSGSQIQTTQLAGYYSRGNIYRGPIYQGPVYRQYRGGWKKVYRPGIHCKQRCITSPRGIVRCDRRCY